LDLYQFDQYRKALADATVFQHLASAELDLILKSCQLMDAQAGQLILAEGRPGEGLYVILEGEIEFFLPERVSEGLRRPSRIRLNVLGPGRCFGEYGFIDDQPTSAAAQALTSARLCFLPKAGLRRIIEQEDRIGKVVNANLLRVLVSRLRGKDKELDLFLLDDRPPVPE
jgi:CRP-like cAMP-binding protein